MSYEAQCQSSQWQSHFKSSVFLCLRGGWLAVPLSQLSASTLAHASDRAAACVSLETTTQWQGHISLWVCHVRTYSRALPIFYKFPLLPLMREERIVTGGKRGYMPKTQSTHICHKWSEHKVEHTLGDLTLHVTALTLIEHGWKVSAGYGEDKEWVEGSGEEWRGDMGCWGAGGRGGAFKQWSSFRASSFYIIFVEKQAVKKHFLPPSTLILKVYFRKFHMRWRHRTCLKLQFVFFSSRSVRKNMTLVCQLDWLP